MSPVPGDVLEQIAAVTLAAIIAVGVLQNALYLFQLAVAFATMRREASDAGMAALWERFSEVTPPISLLAPAYNEEATIVESVRSQLALEFPHYEVIVINDGSKDGTLRTLIEAFGLQPASRAYDLGVSHKPIRGLYASPRLPRLLVVDKENGGKSDALNAGINVARSPLICAMDADSLLESASLMHVARCYAQDPERVIAIGGTIRVANGCRIHAGRVVEARLPRNLLALFQTVEYLRAFLMARVAWSRLDTLLLISGAFGIFRRQIAVEVGGYSHGTVGEDLELVVKMHRRMRQAGRPYRVVYLPEAVCWTEAPESLAVLGRQRRRWQRGALEVFVKHKDMLRQRRYGRVAWLGFSQILLIDVVGPAAELLGYVLCLIYAALGILSLPYFYAFTALTFCCGVTVSTGAVILQELRLARFERTRDLVILLLAAVAENFGYRQLCNIWRIRGTWDYMRGTSGWGTMTRKGFRQA